VSRAQRRLHAWLWPVLAIAIAALTHSALDARARHQPPPAPATEPR